MRIFLFLFLFSTPLFAQNLKDLHLQDVYGKDYFLGDKNLKAVVLIAHGTSCMVVRQMYPKVEKLAKAYAEKNIRFFYLNASLQDDAETIKEEIKSYKITVPVLWDKEQKVLVASGLKVTSEVAVLKGPKREIIYKGAIDDKVNYEVSKEKESHDYLADALKDILADRPVKIKESIPSGCYITIKK